MNGFGFLVPRTEGLRLLGCIWTSSVFPGSAPEGSVFIRCMFGGATDPGAVSLTDGELRTLLEREVHRLLRIQSAPEFFKVFRHNVGIPQYGLDHGDIVAEVEAAESRHPGFILAGNGYRGVSLIDCVASARRAAMATHASG
jgi:oxygen-dependent protoporphyrinogen oxidase